MQAQTRGCRAGHDRPTRLITGRLHLYYTKFRKNRRRKDTRACRAKRGNEPAVRVPFLSDSPSAQVTSSRRIAGVYHIYCLST